MRNSSAFVDSVHETLSLHLSSQGNLDDQSVLDILDGVSIGSWTISIQEWDSIEFSDKWIRMLDMESFSLKEQFFHTIKSIHADDRERVKNFFHNVRDNGSGMEGIEYRLELGGGICIWVLTKGKLIYDRGIPVKYYASCFDITNRKEYEEQLSLKNSQISDFFTNISHEFRTPLSIMLLDLDLIDIHLRQAGCTYKDKITHNISVMRQNTYRMFRLISNLLDVTAVNAGAMSCHVAPGDVVESARFIAESASRYTAKKGVRIRFQSDVESLELPLDQEKYERVLMNLLSNAIKHTGPGGQVCVSLASRPDHFIVNVTDDGAGIPEDKKGNMFNMFRQVNSSLTRDHEGVGIGLALCKGMVELMGGKIWFASKLGSGSTFSFRLPANPPGVGVSAGCAERIPLDKRIDMEFSDLFSD